MLVTGAAARGLGQRYRQAAANGHLAAEKPRPGPHSYPSAMTLLGTTTGRTNNSADHPWGGRPNHIDRIDQASTGGPAGRATARRRGLRCNNSAGAGSDTSMTGVAG